MFIVLDQLQRVNAAALQPPRLHSPSSPSSQHQTAVPKFTTCGSIPAPRLLIRPGQFSAQAQQPTGPRPALLICNHHALAPGLAPLPFPSTTCCRLRLLTSNCSSPLRAPHRSPGQLQPGPTPSPPQAKPTAPTSTELQIEHNHAGATSPLALAPASRLKPSSSVPIDSIHFCS